MLGVDAAISTIKLSIFQVDTSGPICEETIHTVALVQ